MGQKRNFAARLLIFFLGALGFCTGCDGCNACLYGCPDADYKVSGNVSGDDGKPVADARMRLETDYFDAESYSGADGFYEIVLNKDEDGAECRLITKADGYVSDTTVVHFSEPVGVADDGSDGMYEAVVDVRLKRQAR